MTAHKTILTLCIGQAVPFPPAPDGLAQVDDLHRSRVTLLYLRRGRLCRRRVAVTAVAAWCRDQPLLCGDDNWLRRGVRPRAKAFAV